MNVEEVFKSVLDCSFKVHSALGPGLLESAYLECLYYELIQTGLHIEKQKPMPLILFIKMLSWMPDTESIY